MKEKNDAKKENYYDPYQSEKLKCIFVDEDFKGSPMPCNADRFRDSKYCSEHISKIKGELEKIRIPIKQKDNSVIYYKIIQNRKNLPSN